MNDNVGDMPIEIFGDYVADTLGIEYSWEYLVFSHNSNIENDDDFMNGDGDRNRYDEDDGGGYRFGYAYAMRHDASGNGYIHYGRYGAGLVDQHGDGDSFGDGQGQGINLKE